jgi:ribosomal protein S27AE
LVTAEERQGLELIQKRRRNAKYHVIGFVGICIVGGIPTGHGPIAARPAGLVAIFIGAGVLYHMSGLIMVKLFRTRCPRCGHHFFTARHGFFLGRIVRSLWASSCHHCGLSFEQLSAA